MVVPPKPASGLPPDPDDRLLSAVCDQLEPKRLVTTELLLRGPKWRRVVVSVGIEVVAQRTGSSVAEVRQAVRDALVAALSPVPERGSAGWQLGRTVRPAELMVVVAQVPGVRAVIDVLLGDTTGAVLSSLPLVGLELPWLANVAVTEGVAAPVTELVPKLAAVSAPSLPVPVLRHECDE